MNDDDDKTDIKILRTTLSDDRLSCWKIAVEIGVSPPSFTKIIP